LTQLPSAAQTLALQLLLLEAGGSRKPAVLAKATMRVETRLHERLAGLIGLLGYTMLVARALHLAQIENPALKHVTVNLEKGVLNGIQDFIEAAKVRGGDPHAVEVGLISILAHIIALLSTFIGEDLTLRLVREGWPELGRDRDALEEQA
jgi:hypothetical protein